jgi:hypothetical protein
MIGLAALLSLVSQVSGTPYIPGGDSPAGTDCSGLASWVANVASGRPAFGSRFNTGNMESALLARGFHYGSAPGSVVIGWNSGHAAVTLPDGTPVSSGESGSGVRVGGGGAYQPQFSHHMYLPVQAQRMDVPAEAAPAPESGPPAEAVPAPAPEFGAPPEPAPAPEGAFGAGAVIELTAAAPPVDGAPAPVEAPAPIDAPVPPVDPALPPPA